jgi:hypothetical protein
MTTEAKAKLSVEVSGERQIDSLNKKLRDLGKENEKVFAPTGTKDPLSDKLQKITQGAEASAKSLSNVGKSFDTVGRSAASAGQEVGVATKAVSGLRIEAVTAGKAISTTEDVMSAFGKQAVHSTEEAIKPAAKLTSVWTKLGTVVKATGSKIASITRGANSRMAGINGASVGRGAQHAVTSTTDYAWSTLPFGSGSTWSLIDLAAKPITMVSQLAGALGSLAGPLAGVVAGLAALGGALYLVEQAVKPLIGAMMAKNYTEKAVELARGSMVAALKNNAQGIATKLSAHDVAKQNAIGVGLGVGPDGDSVRAANKAAYDTLTKFAKGEAPDETDSAAKDLGLTAKMLELDKKAKKGSGKKGVKGQKDKEPFNIYSFGRDALDKAGDDPTKKQKISKALHTMFGDEIAGAIENNSRESVARVKAIAEQMPNADIGAAKKLNSEFNVFSEKMWVLSDVVGAKLIPPVSDLIATLNSKMGDTGKTIADTMGDALAKLVVDVNDFVKGLKPVEIEGFVKTVRDAFESLTESGITMGRRLAAIADGRYSDAALREGYKPEEWNAHKYDSDAHRAGRAERKLDDKEDRYKFHPEDRITDLEGLRGTTSDRYLDQRIARARMDLDRINRQKKIDAAMGSPLGGPMAFNMPPSGFAMPGGFGGKPQGMNDAAQRLAAAKETIAAGVAALPGKAQQAGQSLGDTASGVLASGAATAGQALGDAAGGALSSSAAIAGAAMAAAFNRGVAGTKIGVDAGGVPKGSIKAGSDTPASAGAH